MSYSTNPVLDQMRHAEALDAAEALRAERQRSMYEETIDLAARGDFARLNEAMDYDDNDRIVFDALRTCAVSGSPAAVRAIRTLAGTYATLFAETT